MYVNVLHNPSVSSHRAHGSKYRQALLNQVQPSQTACFECDTGGYLNPIVMIEGREAIPVRAIPFVTGWTMSPDIVASALAHTDHISRLQGLAAHHVTADGVAPMLPKEWDGIEADLKALSDKLKATETIEEESYPTWRRESIPLLPPACFVRRDEFEHAFRRAYSPKRFGFLDEREGERELNFSPYIPDQMREMVVEGFPKQTDAAVGADKAFSEGMSAGERSKLLKQIGGMALLLAEKSNRFKVGDRPNANQIADAVLEILDALSDAKTRGMGKSSLRESIKTGIELLTE